MVVLFKSGKDLVKGHCPLCTGYCVCLHENKNCWETMQGNTENIGSSASYENCWETMQGNSKNIGSSASYDLNRNSTACYWLDLSPSSFICPQRLLSLCPSYYFWISYDGSYFLASILVDLYKFSQK